MHAFGMTANRIASNPVKYDGSVLTARCFGRQIGCLAHGLQKSEANPSLFGISSPVWPETLCLSRFGKTVTRTGLATLGGLQRLTGHLFFPLLETP